MPLYSPSSQEVRWIPVPDHWRRAHAPAHRRTSRRPRVVEFSPSAELQKTRAVVERTWEPLLPERLLPTPGPTSPQLTGEVGRVGYGRDSANASLVQSVRDSSRSDQHTAGSRSSTPCPRE